MTIAEENEKRWWNTANALDVWARQFPEAERYWRKNAEFKRQLDFRNKIDSYKKKGLYAAANEEPRVEGSRSQEIVDPEEKYKKLEIVGYGGPGVHWSEARQSVKQGGKSRAKSRKYHRRPTRKKRSRRNRKCKKPKSVKK